jgi:hypothetical protein
MNKLRTIGKAILEHYPVSFFSLDQVVKLTKMPRKSVIDSLVILSQEGLIKKVRKRRKEHILGQSPRFSIIYKSINKKALAARIGPRLKEKTIQDRLWFIVRGKRFFTLRDLIALADVKKGTARCFLKLYRRAGIVRPLRPGGPGVVWMLVKDMGPKRPYIDSRQQIRERA